MNRRARQAAKRAEIRGLQTGANAPKRGTPIPDTGRPKGKGRGGRRHQKNKK